MKSIEASARKVLPPNRKALKPYIKNGCLPELWLIANSINADSIKYRGDHDYAVMNPLRSQFMTLETENMKKNLHNTKYQLDTPEGVCAVMGTTRTEGVSFYSIVGDCILTY